MIIIKFKFTTKINNVLVEMLMLYNSFSLCEVSKRIKNKDSLVME